MENRNGLSLLFNYKQTSNYGFNVILGALDAYLDSPNLKTQIVHKSDELVAAARDALDQGRKVVVCWSFYSPQFPERTRELLEFKRVVSDENVIHLAGGVHATADPRQTLEAGFDVVAVGEGESVVIEFVKRFLHDESYLKTKGISYLDDGRYVAQGSGDRIDLNDYPPFTVKHRRFNPIEITRGCIYACKFCQTPFMFKAIFRHRTVENVCEYVKVMKEHGLTDIRFITPTSLSYGSPDHSVNLDKIDELLFSIRSVLGTKGRIFFGTFPSEVRPEHVSREALEILKRYVNNNNLIIGGQSGSQRILDFSKRGHTVEEIIRSVRLSVEAGFLPNVDFIFGMPGENVSDVKASLRLAEKLSDMGARIHGHTFLPLPGTPFRNAPPGKIDARSMRQLQRLQSRGKLYGKWEEQESIAEELSQVSKTSRKSREWSPTN
ncbi:MAG TPA: TIGR04013 family B12-binding domain/radical SAM domain-containing protein [Pyrinomonadaceae bacterium]|nr:TIGR04013 family B12-binding domain/radical SAM domain-containing protein [Pyrinomonadaceae bacterium]